eukprot:gnl/Trimastix_PCT/1313.p1 GENE.gnl/Trimastix_PCT/1313~~gnl/Trimastix_PCT/1313.p1  ORF type:complete len:502 (+),score=181.17 gnl/Trimastix_PCT/1313:40-1545(+)
MDAALREIAELRTLEDIQAAFSMEKARLEGFVSAFHAAMDDGLAGREGRCLQMIPTYTDCPKGNERGRFLALDFGGTNLRVVLYRLQESGIELDRCLKCTINSSEPSGAVLFDTLASQIKALLEQAPAVPTEERIPLGFTFSFPVQQTSICSGTLIHWTKEFVAAGVIDHDVVALLQSALARVGIPATRVPVTAIANDTVGTLMCGCYEDPTVNSGVIFGTGTNACYVERVAAIQRPGFTLGGYTSPQMIVNMEWGGFASFDAEGREAFSNAFDRLVALKSADPSTFHFEKKVSGRYLGLIAIEVLAAAHRNGLLQPRWVPRVDAEDDAVLQRLASLAPRFGFDSVEMLRGAAQEQFDSNHMARIVEDTEPGLPTTAAVLQVFWRKEEEGGAVTVPVYSEEQLRAVQALCRAIIVRSARLFALALTALAVRMRDSIRAAKVTFAIDGSLFRKEALVRREVRAFMDACLPQYGVPLDAVALVESDDGSGKGAAIIAATAAAQ